MKAGAQGADHCGIGLDGEDAPARTDGAPADDREDAIVRPRIDEPVAEPKQPREQLERALLGRVPFGKIGDGGGVDGVEGDEADGGAHEDQAVAQRHDQPEAPPSGLPHLVGHLRDGCPRGSRLRYRPGQFGAALLDRGETLGVSGDVGVALQTCPAGLGLAHRPGQVGDARLDRGETLGVSGDAGVGLQTCPAGVGLAHRPGQGLDRIPQGSTLRRMVLEPDGEGLELGAEMHGAGRGLAAIHRPGDAAHGGQHQRAEDVLDEPFKPGSEACCGRGRGRRRGGCRRCGLRRLDDRRFGCSQLRCGATIAHRGRDHARPQEGRLALAHDAALRPATFIPAGARSLTSGPHTRRRARRRQGGARQGRAFPDRAAGAPDSLAGPDHAAIEAA